MSIELPYNWKPRDDQMEIWSQMEHAAIAPEPGRTGLRADIVAHRRYGKDDISLHFTATQMVQRVGTYWHMLPEASQARKAIWDAINPRTGKRRIDEAFPHALRKTTREQDMLIRFKNESTWQVLGSDNYDSLVGAPPVGVVFSEWSLANPAAWSYIRPILLENGGWAIFIWTPRGRNHATRSFEARQKDPTWLTRKIPATHTKVFTADQLLKERQDMIDEAGSEAEGDSKFRTEYLVDFDAAVPGAYYAQTLKGIEDVGQICHVPWNPAFTVDTCWDLGMDDYTSIWFAQRVGPRRVNFIGHYETGGVGLDTIVKEAIAPHAEWKWGMHYLPHDIMVRELGAGGRTRRETLMNLGVRPIRVGVQNDPDERVNATRRMLAMCWFDKEACATGLDHLRQYRKRWNQSLGVFVGPLHDQHSHAADAIGEYALNAHIPNVAKQVKTNPNPPDSDRWWNKRGPTQRPNWKVA